MQEKEIDEQNKRCIPIVKEILKIVSNTDGAIGEKREKLMASYQPATQKILKLLLEENVKISDISFIQRALAEPFNITNEILTQSMNKHLEDLQDKILGKQPRDLTMQELDDKLQGKMTKLEQKPLHRESVKFNIKISLKRAFDDIKARLGR